MKQITDKLNKIAKAIDSSVETPTTDLIIDSLDAITEAYGGTPVESHLIVDKLEAIAGVASSGGSSASGTIEISSNGNYDVSNYRSADVNVSGGGLDNPKLTLNYTITNLNPSGTIQLNEVFELADLVVVDNNLLIDTGYVTLSRSGALNFVIPASESPNSALISESALQGSNLVNCLVVQDGGDYILAIIDPTNNASGDITITLPI